MRMSSYTFIVFAFLLIAGYSSYATSWDIDKSHSEVGFAVKHMVLSTVTGKFTDFSGEVNFDPDNLSDSKIKGVVKVVSITTENERRDNHLKSADFFDAENYPEIVFESTKISKKDDGYVAAGNLTIRDVTREVEIPFKVSGPISDSRGNTRIALEGRTTINRQEYNVKWDKTMDNGGLIAGNEVDLILRAELVHK